MWQIPECCSLHGSFLSPLSSAKRMKAVVAVFTAVVGLVGKNVSLFPSDLIQSTPPESEARLSCFIVQSQTAVAVRNLRNGAKHSSDRSSCAEPRRHKLTQAQMYAEE